ncbi:hypothetical protein M413DRAFT_277415 [Hebeloma cylindrosporum]|uniref:Uncharacterized protein n=1 Tax=Hebeloma cylindrosporum TaxID=76867 RepID=A0A0C2Y8H6_HEBCY|nr:hypothetical protein M413DRAFT_277415 [Hebeloma cylindrosporum h7]
MHAYIHIQSTQSTNTPRPINVLFICSITITPLRHHAMTSSFSSRFFFPNEVLTSNLSTAPYNRMESNPTQRNATNPYRPTYTILPPLQHNSGIFAPAHYSYNSAVIPFVCHPSVRRPHYFHLHLPYHFYLHFPPSNHH